MIENINDLIKRQDELCIKFGNTKNKEEAESLLDQISINGRVIEDLEKHLKKDPDKDDNTI